MNFAVAFVTFVLTQGLKRDPEMCDGEERDEQSQAEIDVMQYRFVGRLRKMDTMTAEKTVQGVFAPENVAADRPMEKSDQKSEHQACEIRNHGSSLATQDVTSIGRRT